ncbi:DNA-binding protein [Gluconacetobacter sacchari]|nr:DNA-binding protein [Gluconacetobacter sacchari]
MLSDICYDVLVIREGSVMSETLISAETVAQAAESLVGRGEKPSVRKVRDELGGGSPNTILPLLNSWKDSLRGRPVDPPKEEPRSEASDLVSAEMDSAAERMKQGFLAMLAGFVDAERQKAQSAQQAIQAAADQKVALAREAADQQIADIQTQAVAELADARGEAMELAEALAAATAEAEGLTHRLDALQREVDRLTAELTAERHAHQAARATAERQTGEIDALRQAVAEAQARAQAAEKAQDIAERRASTAATALEKAEKSREAAEARAESRAQAAEARAIRAEERADAGFAAALKELAATVTTEREGKKS